jgi:hypothetical protein
MHAAKLIIYNLLETFYYKRLFILHLLLTVYVTYMCSVFITTKGGNAYLIFHIL